MIASSSSLLTSIPLESAEDVVDRRTRREDFGRQIPPLAAGPQKIEDRVHRRAHIGLARPAAGLRLRNQRLQALPLAVAQVAGRPIPLPPILPPISLRPDAESPRQV